MFNSICKCIFRGSSSTDRLQYCLPLLYIRCISTTTKQQSLTVSYLTNTFGFSRESALSVSRKTKLIDPYKVDTVVTLLKNQGFSQTHISTIIRKCPRLLFCNPEITLLPKLEFLYSKGFSSSDLAVILSKFPKVLDRSLENHIIPTFNYLSNLVQSQKRAIDRIKSLPFLLYLDLQAHWAPKFDILLEHGVPKSNILMHMHSWSYSSSTNLKSFKKVVEEVKEMGISPLRAQFVVAVILKMVMSRSKWESKANMFKKWGWSEEEFLKAFRKYPWVMWASEDKIMTGMDFFVNKMGLESSYIARHPILIQYSLQKRIIPRAAVFQFLLSKGLIKSKHTGLVVLFQYSEQAFLERFVNSYDEAPLLLKLYKEKLDLSKTKK